MAVNYASDCLLSDIIHLFNVTVHGTMDTITKGWNGNFEVETQLRQTFNGKTSAYDELGVGCLCYDKTVG